MTTAYPTKTMSDLFLAVSTLKSPTELAHFFRDLMTIQELESISTRWTIAQMLNKKIPYLEIAKQCHVSTTTVTRCALWLEHGNGGYKLALSRLKK
ncbi:MAG: YerC/YecD family TrpR-related protein [bacterium]